jgi:hypothetical protein
MKVLSLATFLLITPSDALHLKTKFDIPVKGADVVNTLINATKDIDIERVMVTPADPRDKRCESDWNKNITPGSAEDRCWGTEPRGLKREIVRGIEDVEREFERADLPVPGLYDADFLSNLIIAEFRDF